MPNLIRTKDGKWRVSYVENREGKHQTFPSIEEAAELILKMGVDDDAIDDAVIAITVYNVNNITIAALFNDKGEFSHLDVG